MRLGAVALMLTLVAISGAARTAGAADDPPAHGAGPPGGRDFFSGGPGGGPSGAPDPRSAIRSGPPLGLRSSDSDNQRVLDGVNKGRYLSLKTLLTRVTQLKLGTIISVELPDSDDVAIYIVKLRDAQGRILTYRLDAASGALIDTVKP